MERRVKERDLAEFGLELSVNLIESNTKTGELFASRMGDKNLSHAIPIYCPRRFENATSATFLPAPLIFPKCYDDVQGKTNNKLYKNPEKAKNIPNFVSRFHFNPILFKVK